MKYRQLNENVEIAVNCRWFGNKNYHKV